MGWSRYTCPVHDRCLYTRECQPLMEQEVGFGGGCVAVHVCLSPCKRGCLLQSDTPSPCILFPAILDLPLSLKSTCLH